LKGQPSGASNVGADGAAGNPAGAPFGRVLYEYKTDEVMPLEVEQIKEEPAKEAAAPVSAEQSVAEYSEQQRQDPVTIEEGGRRKRVTVRRKTKKKHPVGFEQNVYKDPDKEGKIEKGLRSLVVGFFDALFGVMGLSSGDKEAEKPAPKAEPARAPEEREQER
jgi:hypothetical protein